MYRSQSAHFNKLIRSVSDMNIQADSLKKPSLHADSYKKSSSKENKDKKFKILGGSNNIFGKRGSGVAKK